FNRKELMYKFQFNAYQIVHRKQWYRIITHGFLHADWTHLIINMMVLYFFGRNVEYWIDAVPGANKYIYFPLLYFGAIIFSSGYSLYKHKDNHYYNALGASGATSAVLYTSIFFDPLGKIYFYFAIPIPGIVFGVLYLAYSHYMSRKQVDNIGHDAHFWGAVFGFLFPLFMDVNLFSHFINQLTSF
ncbi:MAG: rhomboid family intramembrane serine protease, partial [Marinilabiliales bacterium]